MIRRATEEDRELLRYEFKNFFESVNSDLLEWPDTAVQEQVLDKMIYEGITIIVEDEESTPAGFAFCMLCDQVLQPGKQVMVEQAFWINPAFRGSGLGSELVDGMVAIAESIESASLLTLKIDPRSTLPYNFMIGRGFQPTGAEFTRKV